MAEGHCEAYMTKLTCRIRHVNLDIWNAHAHAPRQRLLLAAVISGLAAGDARPDDRRHGAARDRRPPRRLVALPVGRHRVPRAGDGLAAGLRAAVGPLRAARAAARRHGAVPRSARCCPRRRRRWSNWSAFRALQGLGAGALEGLSFILVADLYAGRRSAALQGAAGRADGLQLHRRAAGRRVPRRPRRLALGVPREPADRRCRARRRRDGAARVGRAPRGPRRADRPRRDHVADRRDRARARRPQPARARRRWTAPGDRRRCCCWSRLRAASSAAPRRRSCRCALFADRRTAALLAAGATGAFGLFAGVLLLPRYFQGVRDVSATHSGLLIYPLLLGPGRQRERRGAR